MAFFLAVLAGLFSGAPMKAVYASVLILLLQQVDSIFHRAEGSRAEIGAASRSGSAFLWRLLGGCSASGGCCLRFPWVRFAKILCFGAIAEKNLTFVNNSAENHFFL